MLMSLPLYVLFTTANVSSNSTQVIEENSSFQIEQITTDNYRIEMNEDSLATIVLDSYFSPNWDKIYTSKENNVKFDFVDGTLILRPSQDWFGQEDIIIQATYTLTEIDVDEPPELPPIIPPTDPIQPNSAPGTPAPPIPPTPIISPTYITVRKIFTVDVIPVNDPPTIVTAYQHTFYLTADSTFEVWDMISLDDFFYDVDSEMTFSLGNSGSLASIYLEDNDIHSVISHNELGDDALIVYASDGEYEIPFTFYVRVVPRESFVMYEDMAAEEKLSRFIDIEVDYYEVINSEHLSVETIEIIGEEDTVSIVPEENWWGSDTISFRTYYVPSVIPLPPPNIIISLSSETDTPVTIPKYSIWYGCHECDVRVFNINDPPVTYNNMNYEVELTSNTEFTMDEPLDISILFNDIDSSLSYSWKTEEGNVVPTIQDGKITSITSNEQTGADTITIFASDTEFVTTYQLPVNVLARGVISMNEDTAEAIMVDEYVNEQTQTYDIQPSEHIMINDNVLNPEQDWYGSETISINAYPILNSINPPITIPVTMSAPPGPIIGPPEAYVMEYSCYEFDVDVASVNDAPTMTAAPAFEMNEDAPSTSVLNVNDYFNDIDSDLEFSVVSDGSSVEFTLADNGLLSVTPSENWFGTEELVLSATDGEFSLSQGMNVNVLPVNDIPYALAAGETIALDEDTNVTLDLNDYIADIDSALWFSCAMDENNATLELNETSWKATITPAENWNGVLDLIVYGSDSDYQLARPLTLNVNAVNDPPTAVSIQEMVMPEDSVMQIDLSSYFEDVDSNLTFMASSYSGKINVQMNSNILSISSSADNWNGEDSLKITASDGEYLIETDIDIVVSPVNDAPVARSTSREMIIDEDSTLSLSLHDMFFDVDGDTLYFSFDSSEYLDLQYDGITEQLIVSPLANWNGESNLQIMASDGVLAATTEVQMSVQPINDSPWQTEVMNPLILRSGSSYDIDLSSFFSDVEGSTLEYTILEGEGITVVPLGDGVFRVTVPQDWEGTETLIIQVSDGSNIIESKLVVSATMPQMIAQSASVPDNGMAQSMFWAGVTAMVCFAVFATYNTMREPRIKGRDNIL